MTTLTPEEAVHRVRVALAEMGWGDARVWHRDAPDTPSGFNVTVTGSAPAPVIYAAFSLMGSAYLPCWSCWLTDSRSVCLACAAGTCAHPTGPHRPPRELLVRAQ